MSAVVHILCHTNQPNKSKLALFNSYLQLFKTVVATYVTRWNVSVIMVGVEGIICVLMLSKEELAWATGKWPRVIYNIMLFKTVSYATKELKKKPF